MIGVVLGVSVSVVVDVDDLVLEDDAGAATVANGCTRSVAFDERRANAAGFGCEDEELSHPC
jgi:hypothetical protein